MVYMGIVAIIPAVDEPDVDKTIRSLIRQTVRPDRIIVAVNNTESSVTRMSAESVGDSSVEVMSLGFISGRKAGAINSVLRTIPQEGYVMVMDADTEVVPTFIERALKDLSSRRVGATGAVFGAEEATGYLSLCQRLEWVRYGEQINRTGKTWVLSGTAGIIKWAALRSVHDRFGRWYDEDSITEDGRLSVDLKVCGWKITSPAECTSTTEVMPSWGLLVKQRTRWFLGALQTVKRAPITYASAPYLLQQITLGASVLCLWLLLSLTFITILSGTFSLSLFWSLIGMIFVVERVVTIPGESWKHKLFAAMIIPELVYALVLQWSFIKANIQFVTRSAGTWTHVERKA